LLCPRKVTCWASFAITFSNSGTASIALSRIVGDVFLYISVVVKKLVNTDIQKILLSLIFIEAIRLWRI
jgi:hypothetical protein